MKLLTLLFQLNSALVYLTSSGPIVEIKNQGKYLGVKRENGYNFYGIPYAKPPIGALRFKFPAPLDDTNFNIIQYANESNSIACIPKAMKRQIPVSEDCLNLNVYMPKIEDKISKKPVLVYIYGSGFAYGNDLQPQNPASGMEGNQGWAEILKYLPALYLYDGQRIISKHPDVLIVTFNYRLGVFGFTSSKEFERQNILNLGLRDCVAALAWIKKNIADFGGDPESITVGGHSSGGILAASLLFLNKGRQELFQRAMILSGSAPYEFIDPKAAVLQNSFSDIKKRVGCDGAHDDSKVLDCLRLVDAEQLSSASFDINYGVSASTVDDFLPLSVLESLEKGQFSKIPIFVSTTLDETRTLGMKFSKSLGKPNTTISLENVKQVLDYLSGQKWTSSELDKIIAFYRRDGVDPEVAIDNYLGDGFQCPSMELANAYANLGIPVFVTRWATPPSLLKTVRKVDTPFHGSDVFFAWQSRLLTPFDWTLADRLTNAYNSFIHGFPKPLLEWANYGIGRQSFSFETQQMVNETTLESPNCVFLKKLWKQTL